MCLLRGAGRSARRKGEVRGGIHLLIVDRFEDLCELERLLNQNVLISGMSRQVRKAKAEGLERKLGLRGWVALCKAIQSCSEQLLKPCAEYRVDNVALAQLSVGTYQFRTIQAARAATRLLKAEILKSQRIPPENRTKVMTKCKAAELLGRPNKRSGVEWLNECIKDGIYSCENAGSKQAWVFDRTQFPAAVQDQI